MEKQPEGRDNPRPSSRFPDPSKRPIAMIFREADNYDWETFLGRPPIKGELAKLRDAHGRKGVLVKGAGGSIGAALSIRLAESSPRQLLFLESSEQNLYEIHSSLNGLMGAAPHLPILGDTSDQPLRSLPGHGATGKPALRAKRHNLGAGHYRAGLPS